MSDEIKEGEFLEEEADKSWAGSRVTEAGITGNYTIIFKNGAQITLEAVNLTWFRMAQQPDRPYFRAKYTNGGGNWYRVAWGSTGGFLDQYEIVGIFRVGEFGNGQWP